METIQGRKSLDLDADGFKNRLANYHLIDLDLGTGDGRYACSIATTHPDWFEIGLDACRDNLYEHSRVNLPNMLFVIAGAEQLPPELHGLCSHLTINFPWGSLLDGLLACGPDLMHGLAAISRSNGQIEIHVNSGALMEAGTSLAAGAGIICENLYRYGWEVTGPPYVLELKEIGRDDDEGAGNFREEDRSGESGLSWQPSDLLYCRHHVSTTNPCSLKRLSKAKTVLIPEERMSSKLTQSTRLSERLEADSRAAMPERYNSGETNSISTSGRISS